MGDDAVAAAPGDVAVSATVQPLAAGESMAEKLAAARSTRAEKLSAAKANRSGATSAPEPADATVESSPSLVTPVASAAGSLAAKTETPVVEDEAHKRGIESIEKRDKRQREQIAAERQKLEADKAELVKLRAEANRPAPLEELKKLPVRDRYLAALKQAGIDPDDDEHMELVARDSYARSKSGKADPKNKAYAEQIAEKTHGNDTVAQLKKEIEDLKSGLTEREQKAQAEQFQNKYLDAAVKAIPATPSLVGQAHSKNPERARAEMLHVGQMLERELGETPTHAEVVAEYEKHLRADLIDRGFSEDEITARLAPPKAAATAAPAPAAKPMRTLDPSAGPSTQTMHGPPTREQRLAKAKAELAKQRRAEG
jgi:hypothetical protein